MPRHGRACPGHPRLFTKEGVDARHNVLTVYFSHECSSTRKKQRHCTETSFKESIHAVTRCGDDGTAPTVCPSGDARSGKSSLSVPSLRHSACTGASGSTVGRPVKRYRIALLVRSRALRKSFLRSLFAFLRGAMRIRVAAHVRSCADSKATYWPVRCSSKVHYIICRHCRFFAQPVNATSHLRYGSWRPSDLAGGRRWAHAACWRLKKSSAHRGALSFSIHS